MRKQGARCGAELSRLGCRPNLRRVYGLHGWPGTQWFWVVRADGSGLEVDRGAADATHQTCEPLLQNPRHPAFDADRPSGAALGTPDVRPSKYEECAQKCDSVGRHNVYPAARPSVVASSTDVGLGVSRHQLGGPVATGASRREEDRAGKPAAAARPQRRSRLPDGGLGAEAVDAVGRDRRQGIEGAILVARLQLIQSSYRDRGRQLAQCFESYQHGIGYVRSTIGHGHLVEEAALMLAQPRSPNPRATTKARRKPRTAPPAFLKPSCGYRQNTRLRCKHKRRRKGSWKRAWWNRQREATTTSCGTA